MPRRSSIHVLGYAKVRSRDSKKRLASLSDSSFQEITGENDKAPDAMTRFRLNRWLYTLCWTGTESPGDAF